LRAALLDQDRKVEDLKVIIPTNSLSNLLTLYIQNKMEAESFKKRGGVGNQLLDEDNDTSIPSKSKQMAVALKKMSRTKDAEKDTPAQQIVAQEKLIKQMEKMFQQESTRLKQENQQLLEKMKRDTEKELRRERKRSELEAKRLMDEMAQHNRRASYRDRDIQEQNPEEDDPQPMRVEEPRRRTPESGNPRKKVQQDIMEENEEDIQDIIPDDQQQDDDDDEHYEEDEPIQDADSDSSLELPVPEQCTFKPYVCYVIHLLFSS
jgi:hypothetical protein